jgi:hypothetical protein
MPHRPERETPPLPYPLGYFFSMLFVLADDAGKDLPRDAHLAPGNGRYHTQDSGEGPLDGRNCLPLLNVQIGLRQAVYLPGLPSASVPVDLRITESDDTQREVAAIEPFRVPADCDDRLV